LSTGAEANWRGVIETTDNRLTQDELATKLQLAGWTAATRSCVSKIESGLIQVPDYLLPYMIHVFRVPVVALLPQVDFTEHVHEKVFRFVRNDRRGPIPPSHWFA